MNFKNKGGSEVAPRAGAWIETTTWQRKSSFCASHPVRVRGLKHERRKRRLLRRRSHPMRVRGLKLKYINYRLKNKTVAPHAGAWIETGYQLRWRRCG